MNFEDQFPLCFYLNLGRRDDRRAQTERELFEAGIVAERFPAVDARWVKDKRGHKSNEYYACTLSHRLALREARRRKATAVLILEDDVVLEPGFREKLATIDLPSDWDVLFFGCTHFQRPSPVSPGLVEAHGCFDNHCYAVRASAYDRVISAFAPAGKGSEGETDTNDLVLASLLGELKGYACFPNLAWQAFNHSDILKGHYSNYGDEGTPVNHQEMTRGLAAEVFGLQRWKGAISGADEKDETEITGCPAPKLALLFLTRADHLCPGGWTEYLASGKGEISIIGHAKNPEALTQNFLKENQIPKHISTRWADISLVRATILLLKEALEDSSLTHFVLLSESCIPTKSFPALIEFLKTDARSWIFHESRKEIDPKLHLKVKRFDELSFIPPEQRRFQSQWMLLNREVAEIIAGNDLTKLFENVFAPDEGYFITLLMMMGFPAEEIINDKITWSRWGEDAGHPDHFETLTGEHWSEALRASGFFARKFTESGAKSLETNLLVQESTLRADESC